MSLTPLISSQVGTPTPFAPYALQEKYQLSRVIQSQWKQNPRPDFTKSFVLLITPHAFCYAILNRIIYVIDLALHLNKGQLNRPLNHKKFTPLHVAVISGNLGATEQLLKEEAQSNSRDVHGWTPLHHAALQGNSLMIELLLARGSSQALTTNMGGTHQDIWNLTHSDPVNPHEKIRLIWQEGGEQTQLTQAKFHELTSAVFIEENNMTRDHLWSEWNSSSAILDACVFPFTMQIAQQYGEFVKKPPIHILRKVTHDSQGIPLFSSPGLGLFAHHPIKRGDIIGEYQGNIRQNPIYDKFLLGWNSGLTHRNEIPQINDGFINVVLVLIPNTKGLSRRQMFIAADDIQPGEQLCWNYSLNHIKLGPYAELRPQEVRAFIKLENVDELIQCLATALVNRKLSFENFVRAEKFRYILTTPSVLFTMTLDGTLDGTTAKKLLATSYNMDCIQANDPKILQGVVESALECRHLKNRLQSLPRMAAAYYQYFITLSAKEGIVVTLALARENNKSLSNAFSRIEKSLGQLDKEGLKKCDAMLLDLWNKNLVPENDMFLSARLCKEA